MQIEQLKLILDALAKMGEAGQDAFIWYMILDKALPMVTWLLTFCGLVWVAIYGIRSAVAASKRDFFAETARAILLPHLAYGEVQESEKSKMITMIRDLAEPK